MEAKWNVGEDYFVRFKIIAGRAQKLTQDNFEQDLIIKIMQIINGRELAPGTNKSIPVRVHSYGSWETAKMDVVKETVDLLQEKAREKMGEKSALETNEDKIAWAKDLQEISNGIVALQNVFSLIEGEFNKKS